MQELSNPELAEGSRHAAECAWLIPVFLGSSSSLLHDNRKVTFHSFIQQTLDVDLLINRAPLGPGDRQDPKRPSLQLDFSRSRKQPAFKDQRKPKSESDGAQKSFSRNVENASFLARRGRGLGAYRRTPPPGWGWRSAVLGPLATRPRPPAHLGRCLVPGPGCSTPAPPGPGEQLQ